MIRKYKDRMHILGILSIIFIFIVNNKTNDLIGEKYVATED